MYTVLVNGCSHATGYGKINDELSWPRLTFDPMINLAQYSDNNTSIARRTMEYLLCHNNITHVFILWTDSTRTELCTDDGRILHCMGNMSWGSAFETHDLKDQLNDFVRSWYKIMFSTIYQFKRFLLDLHHLQLMCEQNKIELACAASMPIDFFTTEQLLENYEMLISKYLPQYETSANFRLSHNQQNLVSDVKSFESLIERTQSIWIDQSWKKGAVLEFDPEYWQSPNNIHLTEQGHKLLSDQIKSKLPKQWDCVVKRTDNQ